MKLEFASRQILTLSQIFDFLGLFCREFNADSYLDQFNKFQVCIGWDIAILLEIAKKGYFFEN
jgi:hypothetical protein